MSLLSKTQYTKISNNLQQIQYQLTEQSNNICNKIQLTLCKIDCIKEVIQQENESNLHEGADKLIQVRERVGVVKDYVCGVEEKYSMNAKAVFQELTKQLNQIQSTSTLNRNERTKQQTALQYKLDEQLSTILEQATQQHNQQLAKIKQLEKQLFSELRECEQEILNSRKQMQAEQEVLLGKVEQIGKDLHSKVKMLREVRKNKKNNFLDLLQNVINKVQDMHVVKI